MLPQSVFIIGLAKRQRLCNRKPNLRPSNKLIRQVILLASMLIPTMAIQIHLPNKTMKKIFISLIFFGLFLGLAALAADDPGQRIGQLAFPIKELGNCENQQACKVFCDDPTNMDSCISFAEKENLMTPQEIALSRKVSKRIAAGTMPGSCKTKDECEKYCNNTAEGMGDCIGLAEELGILSGEELAQAKQVMSALKNGANLPGGCKNKKECETYCADVNHFTDCVGFAEAAGFVSKEEAEMARKVGGKGPGDCRGQKACEDYCKDPAHQDECFRFAKDKDLIPQDAIQKMEEGKAQMEHGLNQAPPEMKEQIKKDTEEIQQKYMQEKRAPTAEELEQIKQEMMQKYMPKDIPTGAPPSGMPSNIPSDYQGGPPPNIPDIPTGYQGGMPPQ